MLGKDVTNICCSTIAVISKNIQHNSCAARTTTLIGQLLIIAAIRCPQALLDSTIDIVLWNIVGLGLAESQLQTHITGRICTAHTNSNSNLTTDFGGNLATNCVICAFFSLNICPLRMS